MGLGIFLSTLLLFISSFNLKQKKASDFTPTFTISENPTHKIPKGQIYTFGYLEVLENRKSPSSKTIKVPVYIFKSRNPNPKKDPIIYTVGGPGSSTMPSAQYMNSYQYLDDRDFILIEQRGTYYAEPHLDCPEWSLAIYESNQPNFDSRNKDELFENAARACKEKLENRGIDLNAYTTNEIAADIHDLVQVLEIEEYNLLTISYSTKIAQVLMRDYPEKIRSVVMDSPLPLEVNYDEESVGNLLQTAENLLADCESEENCNYAFPLIKRRFFDYLIEKTKNPLEVSVQNPKNGERETFYLKGKDLISIFSSTSTNGVTRIPFEINKLLDGDLSTVKEQLISLFQEPGDGAGRGMRLSVWCAEENPFNSSEVIENETYKYPEVSGLSPVVFKDEICKIWSVKTVSEIENEPVVSDIPVLLISGEYDHETPFKWAESMTTHLSKSYHLIFKGWKHTPTTNWSNPCAMEAANEFFNNPTKLPNPSCLNELENLEFYTGY